MHDTRAGFRVDMTDLTTGKHGSMIASTANGFGHILYSQRQSLPGGLRAFHPEYSTANPRGNTWSATQRGHVREIGHFENCLAIDANGNCTSAGRPGLSLDAPDTGCVLAPTPRW
jgi:hypothetical protein